MPALNAYVARVDNSSFAHRANNNYAPAMMEAAPPRRRMEGFGGGGGGGDAVGAAGETPYSAAAPYAAVAQSR